jgi:hypothetical protein
MADTSKTAKTTVNYANGISGLAAALSYHMYHSFWLAVGHSMLGWVYAFYHLFQYGLSVIGLLSIEASRKRAGL